MTMIHLHQQGPRGLPGDVGPRGVQGGPVSITPPLSASYVQETVKRCRRLCVQGDAGQRGPTGEPGIPGAQVAAPNSSETSTQGFG